MKKEEYHNEEFIEEKIIEPINILLSFLIGIAAILFILGARGSFGLDESGFIILIAAVIVIYAFVVIVLLKPKKVLKKLPRDTIVEKTQIIEKPILKKVQVPKTIIRYKEKPVIKKIIKEIEKPIMTVIDKTKKESLKSKYVGSNYTESYHLRNCRFAGVIKPKYLLEENDRKYFKLRGYTPCKVCKPDKN
ncbi:MAG: hypothetical protein U9Q99_02845 [Nanoarchaeota archaeon]|nr:hypothetical protein [Nanoarchaeota archaeon]